MHILFHCITCSRILKCDEIYVMDFVANFMENTTVKNFENWSTFVKLLNECLVARFLLRHRVVFSQ